MNDRNVSIIVLAYNEEGNIQKALAGVRCAAVTAGIDHEIIVVDDGSADSTLTVAREFSRWFALDPGDKPIFRFAAHPENRGLRAAYETGLAAATGDYVTWVPGDGEMATDSIAAIFRAVGTADLVIPYHGTPERRTCLRRLLTWGSTTQLNWLLGHHLNYFQGTVVYPTALARRLPRTVPGFFFCAEMLAHALDADLTYVEIPLEHVERSSGVSKAVSWRAIWAAQKHIVRLWWRLRVRPLFDVLAYATGGPV